MSNNHPTNKLLHCKKLQEVLWRDIHEDFTQVNAKLAHIINTIAPDKNLPLLKITYSFGDNILKNGKLCLLEDFANNPELVKTLKLPNIIDTLNYSAVPFGVFLNKACETFVVARERIIPIFMLRAGHTIGLFETLDLICGVHSTPVWNVTAGARSIFMLAKINNSLWHKRLERHFNVTIATPTDLSDQWHAFTALANSPKANSDWSCDVVFFPKCWIDHLNDKSAGWSQLREYLFKESWLLASTAIEKKFAFIWQQFSLSTMRRNYKPRIYITDTIRHLISIASGLTPAFAPSCNEESAPIQLIKTAYHEVYDLPYAPTLIEPTFVSNERQFVYYSLGYPTIVEGHPEETNIYNTISDLKEIKLLIENMHCYYQDYQKGTSEVQRFASTLQKVDFAYFHKARDNQNEIHGSEKLAAIDKNFCEIHPPFTNKKFCTTSPFFNGCIQIKNTSLG